MDLTQSIQARAKTLRKTGNLPSEVSSQQNPFQNKCPSTKPKPSRSRLNSDQIKPPSVPPFKSLPIAEKTVVPKVEKMVNAEAKESFHRILPPTSSPSTFKPPPPIRDSSLAEIDDEAYDDIQQFQRVATTGPPPLPPPNIKKSVSNEALNSLTNATSYNSATLPGKLRSSTTSAGSNPHQPAILRRKPFETPPNMMTEALKPMDDSMGLADCVKKYQNEFPIQIKMCSAHNGVITINEGEIYNIHFVKISDVVSMTATGGTQYVVPLNSAIEFGVLYNPTNNLQDALQGFLFATAGEIMSTGSVPQVICAEQNCEISSQESSVQYGDVLVVHEVKQKLLRGKTLMCTDIRTEQKKRLLENCTGNFSTTPSHTKMFLPQLLRHIPLPQYCVLFYNGPNAQEVTNKLPRGTVELTRTTTQQTIIVSKHGAPNELMEFPLTNNIKVQPVKSSEAVKRQLLENTRKAFDNFNPTQVQSMSTMLTVENPYTLSKQVALLSSTRSDENCRIGMKLVTPRKLSHVSDVVVTPGASQPLQNEINDDGDYQLPDVALIEYEAAKKTLLEKENKSLYDSPPKSSAAKVVNNVQNNDDDEMYDIPRTPMPKVNESIIKQPPPNQSSNQHESLKKEVENLKQETCSLRTTVEKLESLCKNLSSSLGKLQLELKSMQASVLPSKEFPDTPEANISFLQSLSCNQVLHLIKELNLNEYAAIFAREQIDGSLFCEFDEDVLKDLGISSRIHRMRLSNIITGKASARPYLEKDPYVKCFK